MSTSIELTRITKDAGAVTKRIHLMPDGSIGNDSSQCAIGNGHTCTCPIGATLPG
jgi:hypothetical protein